jgi:hypothetical protein
MNIYLAVLHMGTIDANLAQWLEQHVRDQRFGIISDKSSSFPVMDNRSRIVQRMLQTDAGFLLMIDEDTVPRSNILDLVEKDLDVVGFPCPVWRPNAKHPVVFNIATTREGKFVSELSQTSGLIEVDGIGTGAMLIARRVLEHPETRGAFSDMFDGWGMRTIGGDFHFCAKVLDAGFKVWAAMDHMCSHYKRIDILKVYDIIEGASMPILKPRTGGDNGLDKECVG